MCRRRSLHQRKTAVNSPCILGPWLDQGGLRDGVPTGCNYSNSCHFSIDVQKNSTGASVPLVAGFDAAVLLSNLKIHFER